MIFTKENTDIANCISCEAESVGASSVQGGAV